MIVYIISVSITLILAYIVSLYVSLYFRLISLNVEKDRAKIFSLMVYLFPIKILKQYLRDVRSPKTILFRYKDEINEMTDRQYYIFRSIMKSPFRLFIFAFSPIFSYNFYLYYLTRLIAREERNIKKVEEHRGSTIKIKIKVRELNTDTNFNLNDFIKKKKTKLS